MGGFQKVDFLDAPMVLALLILVPSTVLASDYYLMCCDGFYHKEGVNEGGSLGCTNVPCPEGTRFCATGYGRYKTVRNGIRARRRQTFTALFHIIIPDHRLCIRDQATRLGRPVQGEVSFENCATPGDFKTVYPLFDGFSDFNCQALGTKMYSGMDWSLSTGQQASMNLTCTEPFRQTKAATNDHNVSYITIVSLIYSVIIREMRSDK